jgi:hypothetical protein
MLDKSDHGANHKESSMKALAQSLLVILIIGLPAGKALSQSAPAREVTPSEYERWKKDLSNWGRWGKDDQIGALNLITPAKRREAAGLVTEGFSVSLASDADTVKAVDNPFPYEHEMLAIGNDRLAVRYHGITHTHLDSLAHINDNGVFYNGYKPDADAVLKGGHAKNSIHNLKSGIFTRGVLLDIPRLKGVPYLQRFRQLLMDVRENLGPQRVDRDGVQNEIARGATEEQAVAAIRWPQYEKLDGFESQRETAVRRLYRQLTGALR